VGIHDATDVAVVPVVHVVLHLLQDRVDGVPENLVVPEVDVEEAVRLVDVGPVAIVGAHVVCCILSLKR
jgi:hypothetical protein